MFLLGTQIFFVIQNIFEGLFWFLLPVSLVVCNDIMAYVFGKYLLQFISKSVMFHSHVQVSFLEERNWLIYHLKRLGKDFLGRLVQPWSGDYWYIHCLFIYFIIAHLLNVILFQFSYVLARYKLACVSCYLSQLIIIIELYFICFQFATQEMCENSPMFQWKVYTVPPVSQ